MPLPLTEAVAAFIAAPGLDEVPADVLPTIRNGFIDTVAVLLSGRAEPVTLAALKLAARRRGEPEARVLLGPQRLLAADAAFVNAVAAHALDYDDMALNGHPSVVLVPALLAAGEPLRATDAALLRAYLVGYEVWAELAAREPDALHGKGWHPTSVTGTVAAAAAVAHLAGLNTVTASHAVGIAASMACGLLGNFGSMTKPLHAGWAASHAIEAVQLAQYGATASRNILEGPAGYLAAFSPAGRALRHDWEPGALAIRRSGLSVKKYPVCYALHRVVDGLLDLKRAHGFTPEDIERITGTVSDLNARVLHAHAPADALAAKFSMEFACAIAVIEGAVGLHQVTDAQVARADVRQLMTRVHTETVPAGCPEEPNFALHDRVVVHLRDGRVLDSGPIRYPRGHARLPLSAQDLRDKFLGCASPTEQPQALRLVQALEAVDGSPRPALLDALDAFATGR